MLAAIGSDMVIEIGLLLHDSSRNTLFSLSRVNKELRNLILPLLYRRCTFDFTDWVPDYARKTTQKPIIGTQERLETFLRTDSGAFIFQSIRQLVVTASFYRTKDTNGSKWTLLAEFMSRLSYLHEITFGCPEPVPLALLEVLHQHHPTSRLHVRNWTRQSCDVRVGDSREEALARSPCLRSIEGSFFTGGSNKMDFNRPAFERILSLAPNMESASFSTRSAGGCVVYGVSPDIFEVERREAQKFHVDLPVPKVIKKLRWDNLTEYMIVRLNKIVDLSKLEELEVGSLSYNALLYAQDHETFSGLKHLSFKLSHAISRLSMPISEIRAVVVDFICSLPPLETLSIVTNVRDLGDATPALLHHGSSLRSLTLHEVEDIRVPCRRVASPGQLDQLCIYAPRLSSLEIDINRTVDQKYEKAIYASLSAFPELVRLTLHYDLGLHLHATRRTEGFHEAQRAYLKVDEDFAMAVWKAVGGGRRGSKLEELMLYIGEQNRDIGFGYPASWVLHEGKMRHKLYVRRDERDDRRNEVHVSGTKVT